MRSLEEVVQRDDIGVTGRYSLQNCYLVSDLAESVGPPSGVENAYHMFSALLVS